MALISRRKILFDQNPPKIGESVSDYINRLYSIDSSFSMVSLRSYYYGFYRKDNVNTESAEIKSESNYEITPITGISLDDFRRKYDPTVIIKNALMQLKKGELLTTQEFVYNMKLPGGYAYRDKLMGAEFEQYRGMVSSKVIYWGHPEDIVKLKQERLLR